MAPPEQQSSCCWTSSSSSSVPISVPAPPPTLEEIHAAFATTTEPAPSSSSSSQHGSASVGSGPFSNSSSPPTVEEIQSAFGQSSSRETEEEEPIRRHHHHHHHYHHHHHHVMNCGIVEEENCWGRTTNEAFSIPNNNNNDAEDPSESVEDVLQASLNFRRTSSSTRRILVELDNSFDSLYPSPETVEDVEALALSPQSSDVVEDFTTMTTTNVGNVVASTCCTSTGARNLTASTPREDREDGGNAVGSDGNTSSEMVSTATTTNTSTTTDILLTMQEATVATANDTNTTACAVRNDKISEMANIPSAAHTIEPYPAPPPPPATTTTTTTSTTSTSTSTGTLPSSYTAAASALNPIDASETPPESYAAVTPPQPYASAAEASPRPYAASAATAEASIATASAAHPQRYAAASAASYEATAEEAMVMETSRTTAEEIAAAEGAEMLALKMAAYYGGGAACCSVGARPGAAAAAAAAAVTTISEQHSVIPNPEATIVEITENVHPAELDPNAVRAELVGAEFYSSAEFIGQEYTTSNAAAPAAAELIGQEYAANRPAVAAALDHPSSAISNPTAAAATTTATTTTTATAAAAATATEFEEMTAEEATVIDSQSVMNKSAPPWNPIEEAMVLSGDLDSSFPSCLDRKPPAVEDTRPTTTNLTEASEGVAYVSATAEDDVGIMSIITEEAVPSSSVPQIADNEARAELICPGYSCSCSGAPQPGGAFPSEIRVEDGEETTATTPIVGISSSQSIHPSELSSINDARAELIGPCTRTIPSMGNDQQEEGSEFHHIGEEEAQVVGISPEHEFRLSSSETVDNSNEAQILEPNSVAPNSVARTTTTSESHAVENSFDGILETNDEQAEVVGITEFFHPSEVLDDNEVSRAELILPDVVGGADRAAHPSNSMVGAAEIATGAVVAATPDQAAEIVSITEEVHPSEIMNDDEARAELVGNVRDSSAELDVRRNSVFETSIDTSTVEVAAEEAQVMGITENEDRSSGVVATKEESPMDVTATAATTTTATATATLAATPTRNNSSERQFPCEREEAAEVVGISEDVHPSEIVGVDVEARAELIGTDSTGRALTIPMSPVFPNGRPMPGSARAVSAPSTTIPPSNTTGVRRHSLQSRSFSAPHATLVHTATSLASSVSPCVNTSAVASSSASTVNSYPAISLGGAPPDVNTSAVASSSAPTVNGFPATSLRAPPDVSASSITSVHVPNSVEDNLTEMSRDSSSGLEESWMRAPSLGGFSSDIPVVAIPPPIAAPVNVTGSEGDTYAAAQIFEESLAETDNIIVGESDNARNTIIREISLPRPQPLASRNDTVSSIGSNCTRSSFQRLSSMSSKNLPLSSLSSSFVRGMEVLFGDSKGRTRPVFDQNSVNGYILPRTLLPSSVIYNPASTMWIATVNTNQKALDSNNTAEASKSLRAFSVVEEKQARCIAQAWAPPRMIAFSHNPVCFICETKFAVFRRACHCRNCGVCICNGCAVQWPSKMLPETYNIKHSSFVNICKGCDWLCTNFRLALLEGNQDRAVALYSTGNVNLITPFANVKGELFYPVHCAVLGGNLNLLKWLVDEHCCPIRSIQINSGRNIPGSYTQIITSKGRSLLGMALEKVHVAMVRYLVVEKGVPLELDKDISTEKLIENFHVVLRILPISAFDQAGEIVEKNAVVNRSTSNPITSSSSGSSNSASANSSEGQTRDVITVHHRTNSAEGAEDLFNECIICFANEINCVATPCGHQMCCLQCSGHISRCPVCSAECSFMRVFKP